MSATIRCPCHGEHVAVPAEDDARIVGVAPLSGDPETDAEHVAAATGRDPADLRTDQYRQVPCEAGDAFAVIVD